MLGGGLEGTAELRGTLLAVMRLESLASVCILPPDRAEPPLEQQSWSWGLRGSLLLHFDVIVSWVQKHPMPVRHPLVPSLGLVRVWGPWYPRKVDSH